MTEESIRRYRSSLRIFLKFLRREGASTDRVDVQALRVFLQHIKFERLKSHLERNGFGDIDVIGHGGYELAKIPVDDPFAVRVIETAEKVYGLKPVVWPSNGWNKRHLRH